MRTASSWGEGKFLRFKGWESLDVEVVVKFCACHLYILICKFMLTPSVPIQYHTVHSGFSPSLICNSFLQQWGTLLLLSAVYLHLLTLSKSVKGFQSCYSLLWEMNLLVRGWYLYIVLFGLALGYIAEYWFSNYSGWLFSSPPFPHGYISIFSIVSFIHYCQYPIWGSINTLLVDTLSVLLVGMWNITMVLRVRTI